uniref:Uncharacterized protein n=1 Tax=Arundo donax TaxID=35708 RepID=A0A0A9EUG3_ARUDO
MAVIFDAERMICSSQI